MPARDGWESKSKADFANSLRCTSILCPNCQYFVPDAYCKWKKECATREMAAGPGGCDHNGDGDVSCGDMQEYLSDIEGNGACMLTDQEKVDFMCKFLAACTGESGITLCAQDKLIECAVDILGRALNQAESDQILTCAGGEAGGQCTANGGTGGNESGGNATEGDNFGEWPVSCQVDTDPRPASAHSVYYYSSDKFEQAIDIRVRLTGQDFTISRQYTSDPDFTNDGLVGHGWTLSAFRRINFDNACGCLSTGGGSWICPAPCVPAGEKTNGVDDASLQFLYDLDPASVNNGRLTEIIAYRHSDTGSTFAQSVSYRYMDESKAAAGDWSYDLGRDGDLVTVIKCEHVDPVPGVDPSVSDQRCRVTHYRYHSDHPSASTGVTDGMTVVYAWAGAPHQLKMVIAAEQVEYYTQKAHEVSGPVRVEDTWEELLARGDGDLVIGQGVKLVDLASKVVEQYDPYVQGSQQTDQQGRVLRQYILSNCGCGGGATQGLELRYSYLDYTGGRTTTIEEWKGEVGQRTLHRTRYYDLELLGTSAIPYMRTKAIVDPAIGLQWVTHYVYDDTNHNLVREITPSALGSYLPASQGVPPTYVASTNSGLVHAYDYTTDNYRTEERVGNGFLDDDETTLDKSRYTLVTETTYPGLCMKRTARRGKPTAWAFGPGRRRIPAIHRGSNERSRGWIARRAVRFMHNPG